MVYASESQSSWDIFGEFSDSCGHSEITETLNSGNEKSGQRKSRETVPVGFPKTIDELLRNYPCCPLDAFVNIKEFYKNKYLNHMLEDCKAIKVALRNFIFEINDWTIDDYAEFYNRKECYPYFNAYSRTSKSVYYSIEDSLEICIQLLNYQFDDNYDLIIKFVITLYNVLNKVIPKLNSICITAIGG